MSLPNTGKKQEYISADSVAQLILEKPKRDDFAIIDVRSSDFPGGNLPGALNLTTREFRDEESLDRLIKTHLSSPTLKLVILHCMRSQTRGPYAAYLLSQSPSLPSSIRVVILEGGYQGWYRRFKGRKELNENLLDQEASDAIGWEDTVQAGEGSSKEAEDSKELRKETGKQG